MSDHRSLTEDEENQLPFGFEEPIVAAEKIYFFKVVLTWPGPAGKEVTVVLKIYFFTAIAVDCFVNWGIYFTAIAVDWDTYFTAIAVDQDVYFTAITVSWDTYFTAIAMNWDIYFTAIAVHWDTYFTAIAVDWDTYFTTIAVD
jgi:hypothetical protein